MVVAAEKGLPGGVVKVATEQMGTTGNLATQQVAQAALQTMVVMVLAEIRNDTTPVAGEVVERVLDLTTGKVAIPGWGLVEAEVVVMFMEAAVVLAEIIRSTVQ